MEHTHAAGLPDGGAAPAVNLPKVAVVPNGSANGKDVTFWHNPTSPIARARGSFSEPIAPVDSQASTMSNASQVRGAPMPLQTPEKGGESMPPAWMDDERLSQVATVIPPAAGAPTLLKQACACFRCAAAG